MRTDRSALTFTLDEKREIFKGMVVGELEAGFLRYSRRQALLNYANKLGILEFEACLLIAEAQYHAGDIEPIQLDSAATMENVEQMTNWPVPVKLLVALFVAIFIDLLLIHWLFS